MRRFAYFALVLAVLVAMSAGPAFGGDDGDMEVVFNLEDFINSFSTAFPDVNGDGIPDVPVGQPGIWDDTMNSVTQADFEARVDANLARADVSDPGSEFNGPCGGVAITYDKNNESLDAVLDFGSSSPLLDIFGKLKMTESNPIIVDPEGTIAVWGFTEETGALSSAGQQPGIDYGDDAIAFHDHRWEVVIVGVSGDNGGDPNGFDKNRNAGLVEMGEILPIAFNAKVKAFGAIIDLWGPEELPDFNADTIDGIAGGKAYCFGEGWSEFQSENGAVYYTALGLAAALFAAGFGGVLFNVRPFLSWRA